MFDLKTVLIYKSDILKPLISNMNIQKQVPAKLSRTADRKKI